MKTSRNKMCFLGFSLMASVSLHAFTFSCLGWFGPHDFTMPVMMEAPVHVDLSSSTLPNTAEQTKQQDTESTEPSEENLGHHEGDEALPVVAGKGTAETVGTDRSIGPDGTTPEEKVRPDSKESPASGGDDLPKEVQPKRTTKDTDFVLTPPLRAANEFMASEHEKLTYQISLLGMPAGSAELEAKREKGEIRITLKVNSSPVVSSFYPVDDLIETRHIGGNFILTKFRQKEGTRRSDRGFTIFLRDKSVFWIDRLTNKSTREAIPNSDVVDILSGLYYLRNRPLQIGTKEQLHIYDSDSYASVPVEVLRRETIILPGLRRTDTLVVHPALNPDGIFKGTTDMLIWLSDDEKRVPVRVETSMALGRVTAELIAAETEH